jgi:hypothetical protein
MFRSNSSKVNNSTRDWAIYVAKSHLVDMTA